MTSQTNEKKQWSAGRWGCLLIVFFGLTLLLFISSVGSHLYGQFQVYYDLDGGDRSKSRILRMTADAALGPLMPVLLSHFIWTVVAIALWRALKKLQLSRNEATPVIKLHQSFDEKFDLPSESTTAKSTEIEAQ